MKRIFMTILCLCLVGCGQQKPNESISISESQRLKENFEKYNGTFVEVTIDTNAMVDILTMEELSQLLQNKTGILCIGLYRNSATRLVLPILLEQAIEQSQTIYYLEIENVIDKEQYQWIWDKIDATVEFEEDIALPEVYAIKNGEVVGHYFKDFITDESTITEEVKQDFKAHYQELMNALS